MARIAGVFYLLIIVCGLYSGMFVRAAIVDPADSFATLKNLVSNEDLYRSGFLGDLIMVVCDVLISVLFYYLLKPVHKGIASVAAVFRLIQSVILGANLINLYKPLLMVQGYSSMDTDQVQVLAAELSTQFSVFEFGYLISGMFFAINCLIMGFLMHRSGIFPKLLGIMMALAGFGYMFNCLANFAFPSLVEISGMVMLFTAVLSELSFCLYLLIKGSRTDS